MAGAGIGFMVFLSDDQQLRDLNYWLLGSLGGITWDRLALAAPFVLAGAALLPFYARPLNALLLGESEAVHLGFHVERSSSEERRVGKESVSTCRSRWSPYH